MFFVLKMTMLFLSSEQRCQSIFKRIKVMITIITTVLLLIYIWSQHFKNSWIRRLSHPMIITYHQLLTFDNFYKQQQYVAQWCSDMALDLWSRGLRFDSRPHCFRVQPWASCSHICTSVTNHSSTNLVAAPAGKVTIGMALYWPCVKDNSRYGLKPHGLIKGDEHPALWYPPYSSGVWLHYLTLTEVDNS